MQVALKAALFAKLVAGSGAWAQTAQETLDSEGLAGFTNFEIALGREIQRPSQVLEMHPQGPETRSEKPQASNVKTIV